jgi:hypothetical protein
VLIQDLTNSQEISNTDPSSSLSSSTLGTLNSAFEKLIGDLGGSTGSSSSSTSALQSFLSSFMQNLESSGASSLSTLGTSVNTTA